VKILIADDSVEMRRCIREVLSPDDQIIECGSGREAVEAFRASQPDWVLMDIEMPDQDGLSAAGQIKAACPEARIVFVTAHDEWRLRASALLLGCGFVAKNHLEEIHRFLAPGKAEPNSP
jgi:CheY-like chemotaxis protein